MKVTCANLYPPISHSGKDIRLQCRKPKVRSLSKPYYLLFKKNKKQKQTNKNNPNKLGILEAILSDVWRYGISVGTRWPGVSIPRPGEMAGLFCNFYLSAEPSPEIHYTCCWKVKQPKKQRPPHPPPLFLWSSISLVPPSPPPTPSLTTRGPRIGFSLPLANKHPRVFDSLKSIHIN